MKFFLPFFVLAAASCNAAANPVECPRTSSGKPLVSAGAYFDKQTEIQGARFDVKGGYRVELPLNVRWLVCEYGAIGGPQRWFEVKPAASMRRCTLRVREVRGKPQEAKLACD